jgi:hypothetical protein
MLAVVWFWLYILTAPVYAHSISMSTGELRVEGQTARYTLRMPLYEMQHTDADGILNALQILGALRTSGSCSPQSGSLVCESEYRFTSAPTDVEVQCQLARVTVPNHVHVLHARRGDTVDQAVFDREMERAVLRFRQMGVIESTLRARPAAAAAVMLVAVALGVLARNRREIVLILGGFVSGFLLAYLVPWPLTPAFAESALMIAIGYGALEAALLPEAKQRWVSSLVIGAAMSLYAVALLPQAGPRAGVLFFIVPGAVIAAVLSLRFASLSRAVRWLCLAVAVLWFGMTLL